MRAARWVALSLVAYLLASLLGGPVAAAAELSLAGLRKPDPVPTSGVVEHRISRPDQTAGQAAKSKRRATWPKAATATVDLPAEGTAEAGGTPVRIGRSATGKTASGRAASASGPRQAQVQVLDQRAAGALGVDGVVLAVRPLDAVAGAVDVEVDYSAFRNAFGGDWASRLTLSQLPSCALSAPDGKGCGTSTPLKTVNDTKKATLSASVALAATGSAADARTAPVTNAPAAARSASGLSASDGTVLLAATAAASGASGDFAATSLAPSASWSAGGSNGGFSWTYDIATPEVPGGAEPELSLSYSSQAVDGRTAATNNQSNWIGDGWSMEPGYIERRYISCADDVKDGNGTDKSGDLCWKTDNAVLNLGGQSNVLVKDDTSGEWHLQSDDGTKIDRLTSANRGNGDNDGEYWRVTTPDGTRYYFGYNRLPGWTEGKPETNSTWTVPVFGNHADEPCHASAFKDSWCKQAWRWNLDYVVDPHSDAMAYYWEKETNYYGRDVNADTGASTATVYDRGGHLDHIDYGLRSDTMYGKKAAGRVDFKVSERCLSDCGTFDSAHAKNWPDVPFDRYCKAGDTCKDRYSPSFWSRKRLTQIDTSVLTGGAYKPVDTWKLDQKFPPTGDGTDPALWLESITRTGHTGTGDTTLPAVTFKGQQLANRVEGATTGGRPDPVPPLVRYRVYGIDTETGGTIGVTYSERDCKAGDVPKPASNTRRCYPVMWSPPDAPAAEYEPYLDWFHTYVATQVLESDNTGGAPVKETDYKYLDGMAWAKEEDEFTKAKHLTYGDRKGYGRVQVRTGAPAEGKQTLKEYRYFRGIDGAEVADHEGVKVTDHDAFAGMTREEATYNGDGGKLVTTTAYEPWHGAATATHKRTGLSALTAYATGSKSETSRTAVGDGWRSTRTVRTFDAYGLPLTESDLGDTAKSGDEVCTTTSYARNTEKNLLTLVKEVRKTAVACDRTPALPADLISVERHYYDGATALDTAPVKGDVTRLDEQDDKGTGYLTTARHTYDLHGRELTDTDADDNTTTTAYTPTTIEAPTSTAVTNALGHVTTTENDPARGLPTAVTDPNGKRTDAEHDGLGRTLRVWGVGWSKADHAKQPSTEYGYTISRTDANAVSTRTLQYDGSYTTSYQLFDGLLRERETQAPAIGTKNRVVTETLYNSRGDAYKTYAAYYTDGAPSRTLVSGADNKVPSVTENVYDGVGRVTDAIARTYGDDKYRTRTVHEGDRTTVIPPAGGTATTVITDARGRTTSRLEYTDAARTTSQATTYTYGKWDEPLTITDPAGNTWTHTFDARGQETRTEDPDKGASTTTYDRLGRAATATDARGVALTTGYDELGRRTSLKKGDTPLAKWTYDTVAKGQAADSVRYIGGKEYTSAVTAYDDRYQPTASTATIPAEAGALAGTYSWTFGYNAYTGAREWIKHPAVGNLPSERQTTVYGEGNLPLTTTAGAITLVNSTSHDVFSRPVRTEYGTLDKKVYRTRVYDAFTGRVIRQTTDRDLVPQRIDDTSYAYDEAGGITGITTASGQDADQTTDTQCFTNDALGRLSEAWTATEDCAAAPTATTVGGPDSYWETFAYDAVGNRTGRTDHGTGALAGSDATTTYGHNTPGTGLPHAVQTTSVKGGALDGQQSAFAYDKAGNTTRRTIGARTQDLTWDDEGSLATLTEGGRTTGYQYDADGNRLITKDADGSQTLTLPGGNELKIAANGTKEGVRYYTHEDETVAVRTGDDFSFLLPDHQGTSMAAVAMTTLAITRRKQLPFGELRSEQTETIPGTRGFVGGTRDQTGLVHLGAREYDPTLGRFLSVDPVIDVDEPAQMNAYAYAHNSPVTKSDPDGLRPLGPTDGGQASDDRWAADRGMSAGYVYKNGKWVWNQTPLKDKESRKKYAAYRANPSHYLIDDSYARKRTAQAAASRKKVDAQLAAQAKKAQEERRKKDGIWGNIKKGNWGAAWGQTKSGLKDTFGTWDGWKNRVLPAVGFGACLIVSAGACTVLGVGIVGATFLGDGLTTGSWNYAAAAKSLTWTIGGGVAARMIGGSWRGSAFVSRNRVQTVHQAENVTIYGYRKTLDVGATYANISINAGLGGSFCGAGAASPGNAVGAC
ncbi:RHS repeat-associated core domain-containing protein [Streptomyces sp. NPDC014734]|uniref:RHS repeat-associated core domain-containing protein n=1 Tax=Streptomyces sp. NPDC014734 TaxID=3364886 RepID=UPI0037006ACA